MSRRIVNGASGNINFGTSADLNIQGDLSIGIWVLLGAGATNSGLILSKGASGETEAANAAYQIDIIGSSNYDIRYIHEYNSGANQLNTFNTNFPVAWKYIGVTRDAAAKTVKLWVGELDGSIVFINTYNYTQDGTGGGSGSSELALFDGGASGTQLDDSSLSNLIIHTRTLSEAEHLAQMLTRVPSPTDLELWCKLTGVDSPEPDESGNGYSGVLTGTVQDADPGLILLGDTGIASEEALGTGSVAHVSADKAITGVAGIASGESFDVGIIYQQLIEGVTSISSQEAFDIGVVRLYQTITGVAGIASEETLDLGVLVGPITGVAGIISAEAFEVTGSISNNTIIGAGFSIVSLEAFDIGGLNFEGGPIAGVTGIPSGEDFPLGIVAGPILGVSGIASEGAMGLGSLAQVGILLTRPNGIASLEFFDKLGVLSGGPVGYLGIASAEKFGPGTVMRWDAEFLANSNYVVYVDGQPINDYLRESSISGDLQINFNGSCSFQTIDRTGAWEPEIGQEIVIMRYIAATDTWDRAFGGSVQNVQITRNPGDTTTFHDVSGVDYGHFAGRRVLNMKFDKEQYGTLTSILEFINATILEQEGITWVNRGDPGTVIDTIEFNYIYLNQVFDQLKEITGWDWATDRWRNFYMYNRPAEIIAAPTQIRDDTTGQYAEVHRNASVNRSRGLYRNVQHVKANIPTLGDPDGAGSGSGYYWSTAGGIVSESYTVGLNDVLRYFDGKLLEDHRYDGLVNEIISFQINGEDAVIWPVKPDGYWDAAPGGWDYRAIWPREISYIWDIVGRWDEAPGPGDTVTITFSSEAGGTAPPVISTDITDPVTINEITVRADIEPGSGVYENVYDAGTIDDPALLETIANELLSQFSEMGLEVDFETYVDGLWPGQTLRVDLPGQGVDEKDLIIEQVSFQEEQKTRLLYRVKASNKVQQRDAMAAIARLIRRINKAPKVTGNSFLFELAPSQQGFVNAGIQVGNDVTSHAQAFQNFTCSKIIVMPKNPPTGSSATINIKANGVSILQGGALDIPAGSGEFTTSAFSTGGLTLPAGATLTVDILGVGSSSPGSDISIQLVGFFG